MYIQSLRPTSCVFIYKSLINIYKIIYKNWKKIHYLKATGWERLILRISTPGITLWTQDIFQYEALHLLQSVSQQYSKKNSVAVRGPSRLQNTPMQYRGPISLQEELPCSSRPFSSRQRRSHPATADASHYTWLRQSPSTLGVFLQAEDNYWTLINNTSENLDNVFLQRLKIYTLYINNI